MVPMNFPNAPIDKALEKFGLSAFRPGQREVIESILAGNDCLCVMPTGGGKSLCYQLPSLIRPGLTIVVSPLIALMKDQVDGLSRNGIPAALINSTLNLSEQMSRLEAAAQGKYKLLYVAPERLRSPRFLESIRATPIQLLAIDEAHCISQWGHDFRPDYSRIGQFREFLGGVQTVALTATATPRVREDIVKVLELKKPRQFMSGFARPNLHFGVVNCLSDRDKDEQLANFLRQTEGTGIIYAATRKRCETLVEWIGQKLKLSAGAYHAGLVLEQRRVIQERFMSGQLKLIVATNAFGMGIDKPDLRFVIHYNIPGSLEAYYQEAGRAGRDGRHSVCVLLYSYSDRHIQEFFIENNYPPRAIIQSVYEFLLALEEDPIELTLEEIRDRLGLSLSPEAIGSCLQILSRTRVLERLEMGAGLAMVRIHSELPTLVDLLPKEAKVKRTILRLLEKAVGDRRFEDVYLHPQWMQQQLGMDRDTLSRHMREISRLDAIDYVPPFRGRAVHFRAHGIPFDELNIDFENLRQRKEAELERLNQVIQYAQTPLCRQAAILHYFGDPDAKNCRNCDRCQRIMGWPRMDASDPPNPRPVQDISNPRPNRPAQAPSPEPPLNPQQKAHFLSNVIDAVDRIHGRLGKILIAQYLSGSNNSRVQNLQLHRLPSFGMLKGFKQADAVALLELLINAGLLRQQEVNRHRPTVSVSSELSDPRVRHDLLASVELPASLARKIRVILPKEAALGPAQLPQPTPSSAARRDQSETLPARLRATETESLPSQSRTSETEKSAEDRPDWYWTLELMKANHDWSSVRAIRRMSDDQLSTSLCDAIRAGVSIDRSWLSTVADQVRTAGQQRVLRELQRRSAAGVTAPQS